ncbi:stalk domain-containing protein, partial [Paenibacillus sp. TAF58]
MRKKLVASLLSFVLLASCPQLSKAESSSIPVLLNGEAISFEVQPFIENGTTLVPFRSVFEKFGLDVSWNGDTQTITGHSSDLTVTLQIGSKTAKVNGASKLLTVAPKIKDGNTFIPLRFIGEASGKKVIWDDKQHTVLIRDGISSYLSNTLYTSNKKVTYVGDDKNGQRDGHGSLYSDGKLVFEGDFKDNQINGTGALYWLG